MRLITLVCGTCPDTDERPAPMVTVREEHPKPGLCPSCGDESWLYAWSEPDEGPRDAA